MLDELRDLQVFYINIGGGEPMIRRDFFELRRVLDRPGHRRQVLHQRRVHRRRQGPPPGGDGLPRHPDQPRRHRRRHQRRRPRRRARYDTAMPGDGPPAATPASARSRSASSSPATTSTSSTSSRRSPTRTAPSCASPACARRGRGADTWHDLHPTNAQQRQIYDWLLAHGDNVLTGDSFFHLNALGDEPLPGPQHVRRRPGRVPHRPDRRRLRLPVRDPRRVQGRHRSATRAASPRSGSRASCSVELREPQSAGACA